jgi:hypothetical protein
MQRREGYVHGASDRVSSSSSSAGKHAADENGPGRREWKRRDMNWIIASSFI